MPQAQNNLVETVRVGQPFDVESSIEFSGFKGKTILITGGASGLGEGFFRKWAAHGANVIIGDINSSKGNALVEEVRESTKNADLHFLHCNVADWQSQVDFFRDAVKLSPHGGIDAVVVNAGVVEDNPTFDSPPDSVESLPEPPRVDLKTLEINLFGAMYTSHLAFHYLAKNTEPDKTRHSASSQNPSNRDRHLLLIGSMAGISPMAAQVQYCTSKHAIVGLYRSLMCTAFTKGIRINLLMPYFTDTPLLVPLVRVALAGVPMAKIEDVVNSGTRLMGDNKMNGKALVVGPAVNVTEDFKVVPSTSKNNKAVTTWEVYGQDFDDVDTFTCRYISLMNEVTRLNGWAKWSSDIITAVFNPLTRLFNR